MRRFSLPVLFCALLSLLIGCAASLEEAVVGRYHGEVDLTNLDPEYRERASQAAAAFTGALAELKANKRASFSIIGPPMTGTWKLEGTRLTVTTESGSSMDFQVLDGGKRLMPILDRQQLAMLRGAKLWLKKE